MPPPTVWGDTGRYPQVFQLIQQVYGYFQRLEELDTDDSTAFVHHALAEQRALTWFENLHMAKLDLGDLTGSQPNSAAETKETAKTSFASQWEQERRKREN